MKFIRKVVNWFRSKPHVSTERDWEQVRIQQQTIDEMERIKAQAFYLPRGL